MSEEKTWDNTDISSLKQFKRICYVFFVFVFHEIFVYLNVNGRPDQTHFVSSLHQTVYFIKKTKKNKKQKQEETYHYLEKIISTTNK